MGMNPIWVSIVKSLVIKSPAWEAIKAGKALHNVLCVDLNPLSLLEPSLEWSTLMHYL